MNHHNTVENVVYSIKFTIKNRKNFLVILIIQGICWGANPLIFAYLPKIIIDMLTEKVGMKHMVMIMIFLTLLLILFGIIQDKAYHCKRSHYLYIKMRLTEERMKKAFAMDYKNLEKPDVLNLMDRARFATEGDHDGFGAIYNNIICAARNLLTIAITVGTIAVINPWIIIVICILCYGEYKVLDVTKKVNKRKYTDIMPPRWRKIAYLNNTTNDFEFAKDIRIYNMRPFINKKNREVNDDAHLISKKMFNRWILCTTGMSGFTLVQNVLLYTWLIYSVLYQDMSMGNFALYIGIVKAFTDNIVNAFDVIADTKRASLEIDDYRAFLEYPDEKYDDSLGEKVELVDCDIYEFKFEKVWFQYPGQEKYALEDINITIQSGEKLAVVGMNGAGKTTFVKLLMRLYEPTKGRILLNGIDVRRYDKKDYYKIFAPVFQEAECFAMPIKQNISMTIEEETEENRVSEALEKSGLERKVNELEFGINTELLKIFYSDGIDLSGGEKQKLMLARSLYKEAEVMILDEPTAALDALAEDRMYKQFNKIVQGKTAIYISHRLASTRFCDNIAMFENGRIVEMGTHEELLLKNQEYRKMYDVQSVYYKEGVNLKQKTNSVNAEEAVFNV